MLTEAPPVAFVQMSLMPGMYHWRVQALDDDRIVGPTGEVGQWSDWAYFTVK